MSKRAHIIGGLIFGVFAAVGNYADGTEAKAEVPPYSKCWWAAASADTVQTRGQLLDAYARADLACSSVPRAADEMSDNELKSYFAQMHPTQDPMVEYKACLVQMAPEYVKLHYATDKTISNLEADCSDVSQDVDREIGKDWRLRNRDEILRSLIPGY